LELMPQLETDYRRQQETAALSVPLPKVAKENAPAPAPVQPPPPPASVEARPTAHSPEPAQKPRPEPNALPPERLQGSVPPVEAARPPAETKAPSTKPAVVAVAKTPQQPKTVEPPEAGLVVPAAAALAAPSATSGSSTVRTAGIITALAGVAALGAGGAFFIMAKSAQSDIVAAAKSGGKFDPGVQDRVNTNRTLELGCFAAGGAALLTGTILFFVGRARAAESLHAGVSANGALTIAWAMP
jgi:hypothetical protein